MKDKPGERSSDTGDATPQDAGNAHPSSLIPHLSSLILRPSSCLFLVIWLILLVGGRSNMLRDPGTLWHVAVGERMLASGQVIREDPFSFTRAGHPWVADQWLAECGMAIVHRLAGWDGLLLVTATLLAGVYAWIGARLLRGGLHLLPAILLLALAMLAGAPQFHLRPLVATIVLLGVTFGWLVDVENGSRRFRQLWWLVPLFILWTNLHGGVLGGLGTVGLCLGGWSLSAAWQFRNEVGTRSFVARTSEPIALLLAVAAAVLVSPYGLAMPREWLETLRMPLPKFIAEHAPLELTDPIGWGTLALAAGYLATLIGVFPQRPRITWLVPLVWFALALSRLRNAPLFGITAVIALADMLPYSRVGRWLQRRDLLRGVADRDVPLLGSGGVGDADVPRASCRRRLPTPIAMVQSRESATGVASYSERVVRFLNPLLLPAIVVVAAMLLQIGGVRVPVIGHGWARFDPERWPIELLPALRQIDRSSPDGTRIFNDLNFGGFLIYHTPRLRIFVDDRCPLYGTEFLLECERTRCKDPAQIDDWQRKYGFRYALVQSDSRLVQTDRPLVQNVSPFDRYLSESAEWSLVKRSPVAALYRHR
jgi:hypothetical protein